MNLAAPLASAMATPLSAPQPLVTPRVGVLVRERRQPQWCACDGVIFFSFGSVLDGFIISLLKANITYISF